MDKIDTSPIIRFLTKLNVIRNADKLNNEIINAVANRGVEILNGFYGSIENNQERPIVNLEIQDNYARIIAQGEDVMFIEFGTGSVGFYSNYPSDKLPQSRVPITGNWQYNYINPLGKEYLDKDGNTYQIGFKILSKSGKVKGWKHNGVFTRGFASGQQIFNTARQLEIEIPNIVKQILNRELKNV